MFNHLNTDDFLITLLLILPLISFLVGYTIRTHRSWSAENTGEAIVRHALKKYCEDHVAHVLNNVTLRLEDGTTTQIDHVLVSTKGIFVIETKHYKGWIFGDRKARSWAQILYREKFSFQNPLFQNYKHVKEIQRIFDFIDPSYVHNIVVFSGSSVFKTDRIENVCYVEELLSKLEKLPDGVLSLNRVQFCVGRIEYMRLHLTKKTDVEHQAYLTQKFGQRY